MKKTLAKVAGLAFLATGLLLASCTTDASNISSSIDTVLSLTTPVVKATAYPGMNYVSWKPVAGADGFVVYIYEDDHHVRSITLGYEVLNYTDVELKNGAKYTYYVEATSKSSTSRSVVTENSMSEPVSVTGIVPSYNVKSLDLVNHEKGIDQAGEKEYVLAAKNIHVARDFKDKFSISFPVKAYLNYDVYYTIGNEYDTYTSKRELTTLNYLDNATNDKIMPIAEGVISVGGVYHITVVANAENNHFGSSDPVVADETIEVETLNGDVEDITSAAYVNANKVRVVFPKFVLDNGKTAPASYYKVYRSVKDKPYTYTPVSGAVKAVSLVNTASFYVEDTVEDNTVDYVYTLVVTDGTRYAGNVSTADVAYFVYADQDETTVSGAASTEDTDAIANDITWTITLPAKDVKIEHVYIYEKKTTDVYDVASYDFDRSEAKDLKSKVTPALNTDGTTFNVFTTNHAVGNTVYMLVVTSQDNKAQGEWINEDGVDVKYNTLAAPALSAVAYDNRLDDSNVSAITTVLNDVIIEVADDIDAKSDSIDNYSYKVFVSKSTLQDDIDAGDTITFSATNDWLAGEAIELKNNSEHDVDATTLNYVATKKYEDITDGLYAYKVVKTRKATGEEI
ncbi:MAG: hypothetical protein IIT58_10820, partial [Treponema sp.]|nr:hypothetical protein [Treponema sp.]